MAYIFHVREDLPHVIAILEQLVITVNLKILG